MGELSEAFKFYVKELLDPQVISRLDVDIVETTQDRLDGFYGHIHKQYVVAGHTARYQQQNGKYRAIIRVMDSLSILNKLRVIAHETVHLKQAIVGESTAIVNKDGTVSTVWKGRVYHEKYSANEKEKHNALPWESEAIELEGKLLDRYVHSCHKD